MPDGLDDLLRTLASAPPLPLERLERGSRLGPYRIDAPLGRGGMGRVYRATDTRLGRPVALKVLERTGSEARDELLREARAAAAVEHPAVVTIYDVGVTDEGRAYVVMELVEGAPLSEHAGPAPLEGAEALRLARSIAGGLAHLHERGIVHRDLKPSNVVVRADGAVKLVDFGLATRARDPAEPAGTRHYVAPEVRRGDPIDARADVYAFGVLLRWLGSRSVDGPAPPRLRKLAAACTESAPDRRPVDGSALVRALDRLAQRRTLTRASALIALTFVALGTAAVFTGDPPPPAAPVASPAWTRLTDLDSSAMLFEGAIAPDGARLAYAERRGVFIRDLASGAITTVAGAELGAHCVAWSGDGARLFIGGEAVHAVPLAEGTSLSLERVIEGRGCPVPSPDGRWLAIERADRLELLELARPGAPRVLLGPPQLLVMAAWSPRSDRLAALRIRIGPDGAPTAELSVHDVASSAPARVLRSDPAFLMPTRGVSLAWLDDESLLVGYDPSGMDEAPRELLRTPADRWAPTLYATLPFDPCRLTIDRSGRLIATSHAQDSAVLVASVGEGDALSEPHRISRSLRALEPSDWAPGSDAVLGGERTDGSFRAVAQPIDDRLPEPLSTGGPATWPLRSAGGALVFWRTPQRPGPTSLVWRAADGHERELLRVEGTPADLASWRRPPTLGHRVRCDPSAPRCVVLSAPERLLLLDVRSGERRAEHVLAEEDHPLATFTVRWDPDPLVAIPTADNRRIALVRLGASEEPRHLILPDGCNAQRAEWNAAGDALFVSGWCEPPEPYRIMRLSLDGELRHLLRSADRWLGVAALSPDGRSLALQGQEFRSNLWSGANEH